MRIRPAVSPLVVVAALVLVAACGDSTEPEPATFTIAGRVVDAGGAPVADAAILLDFDFAMEAPTAADKPRVMIGIDLPEPTRYTVRITDVCDDQVFFAVTDSAAEAGVRGVLWDARDLEDRVIAEGLFHVHLLVAGQDTLVSDLALARNVGEEPGDFGVIGSATVRETWRAAAWTDSDGRFVVDRDCWEFGQASTATDENGDPAGRFVVAPRIRAWAYPADRAHGSGSAWTPVDATRGAEITITVTDPGRTVRIP